MSPMLDAYKAIIIFINCSENQKLPNIYQSPVIIMRKTEHIKLGKVNPIINKCTYIFL